MAEVLIRPMRPDDVPDAERISDEAFHALDVATVPASWPAPRRRSEAHSAGWLARTRHFLEHDAAGCWVAEDASGPVGFATSIRRDGTWVLATYAVLPGHQGHGTGKQLLDAALTHSAGCLRGMLSASSDPRAVRRYLLAGFTLHPQMFMRGTVDRTAIPAGTGAKVREGSAGDLDLMDSVDRATRGSGHGPDHVFLRSWCRTLVTDSTTGSGYAHVGADGSLMLLAATNRRTALRLLWTVVADGPEVQTVSHLTAANDWAVGALTTARLELHQSGYLALRGMKPPAPYVHHGAML